MRVIFKAERFFSVVCERASERSSTIDTEASNICEHKLGFLCLQAAIDRAATLSKLQGKPFFFFATAVLYWSDPSTVTEALSCANINKVGKSCGGLTALPGDSANLNPNSREAAEARPSDGDLHRNTAALFNSVDFSLPKQI